MIKLKSEINKEETMRNINLYAEKKYGTSANGINKIWAFVDGAAHLLNLLRLPVVTNSLRKKTDGLSLVPDITRFVKDVLDNYDTMSDDAKKTLLYNVYRGLQDLEQ